jgi:hypothetical protein
LFPGTPNIDFSAYLEVTLGPVGLRRSLSTSLPILELPLSSRNNVLDAITDEKTAARWKSVFRNYGKKNIILGGGRFIESRITMI